MKKIAILGSTGAIGTQTLEVVRANKDIEVTALEAGSNIDLLEKQIREFSPKIAAVWNEEKAKELKDRVRELDIRVESGMDGLLAVATELGAEIVVTAVVGMIGIRPTIAAMNAGKDIALANKETLVTAGHIIMSLAKEKHVRILPVDSEHSAIFQCLNGEHGNKIEMILFTASGGLFRGWTREQMKGVQVEDALKHPNWTMGAKITIDSASMMNKGFEMIEAKWLFDVTPDQVQVVVHPQSVIHSMVQFEDGAVIAQLGIPDMKLPIAYAFSFPTRMRSMAPRLDFNQYSTLTFEEPDMERFRNLAFAFEAARQGGNMPCILNAANEVVVAAFLQDRIGFLQMSDVIEQTMRKASFIVNPSYEDYVATDTEARRLAAELF